MAETGFDPRDYWEERLRKEFSLHGVGYGGLGESFNKWMYKVRERVFARLLKRNRIDARTRRVLDIGSGTGFYIDQWQRAGAVSLTGCDITDVAVQNLRARYPSHRFERLDVGEGPGPLKGETFDVVTALDVLFHIVDDERYLSALRTVGGLMADDGFFIFSDNFLHHSTMRARHQVSRSLADIEAMLSEAGLEVVERRPMFVLMNYPIDSADAKKQKRWRSMTARARKSEAWGRFIGGCLYPIELVATRFWRESPTTEIMVCRKG